MIEPIESLSFSIHSNKGLYALLLGSGISRPAGIPTGWEIVLDLIRKIATMRGEDCEPDPDAWYEQESGKEPDYSDLLKIIVKTSPERSQILRRYFEPSEDELDQGLKTPTAAHMAIAELVSEGYIKVIITTNFDRLLETALKNIGITPTVISTDDTIEGAMPIIHTGCTIIKVNGDYVDTRIKNTTEELSTYSKPMKQLLDKVFDEFGLIVCGWSAEWDIALCSALDRCKNRRFTTYWTSKSEPNSAAKRLIEQRRAELIRIESADSFFSELKEKTLVLSMMDKPHPLSVKMSVELMKKYLPEERYNIKLHDLVMEETEKTYSELNGGKFPTGGVGFSGNALEERMQQYEALIEKLQAIYITGCYWGEIRHTNLWHKSMKRISNPSESHEGRVDLRWLNLRYYPALVLFYSGGLAAFAAERYYSFAALFSGLYSNDFDGALVGTHGMCEIAKHLPGIGNHYVPLNGYLFGLLREPLRYLLPDDKTYEMCFDRFEYILGMVVADFLDSSDGWGPIGCFGWKLHRVYYVNYINQTREEIEKAGDTWPLLKAGLFNGSLSRAMEIQNRYSDFVGRVCGNWK